MSTATDFLKALPLFKSLSENDTEHIGKEALELSVVDLPTVGVSVLMLLP